MESEGNNHLLFFQSPDPNELPVLELDLGWELPDFASIGKYLSRFNGHSLLVFACCISWHPAH